VTRVTSELAPRRSSESVRLSGGEPCHETANHRCRGHRDCPGIPGCVAIDSRGSSEPTYRGKTLGAWLDDRYTTPAGQVVLSNDAVTAVQAIGPKKAIPTLLTWLRTPDSSIRQGAKIVLEWKLKLPVHVPTNYDKGSGPCGASVPRHRRHQARVP